MSPLSVSQHERCNIRYWSKPFSRRKKEVSNDNIFGREKEKYTVRNRDSFHRRFAGFNSRDECVEVVGHCGQPSNVRRSGLHLCREGHRTRR